MESTGRAAAERARPTGPEQCGCIIGECIVPIYRAVYRGVYCPLCMSVLPPIAPIHMGVYSARPQRTSG